MPILYVHGVNVRSRDGFRAIEGYLRRYLAPIIAADPDQVLIDDAFWGPDGVRFAWGGISRPLSRILGMGAGATELSAIEGALTAAVFQETLHRIPAPTVPPSSGGGLISSGATSPSSTSPPTTAAVHLHDLSPEQISDLLAAAIAAQIPDDPEQQTLLILAADTVAHQADLISTLTAAGSPQAELLELLERVQRQAAQDTGLLGQGFGDWFERLQDRLGEGLNRALDLPSYAISVVAAEIRKPLNELISVFIGDVFTYLSGRGNATVPGVIPEHLITKLKQAQANKQARGGEPIIILTHSMGGQLVYDAVTHFLPNRPELSDIKVDFWCASASQVGFFEEAKLFLASLPQHQTGNPAPFPHANLGVWWNVWDHNDFLSFTAKDIFAQLDDAPFDSGMSLLAAHGGYLQRPSFYRRFAAKLEAAKANAWSTP